MQYITVKKLGGENAAQIASSIENILTDHRDQVLQIIVVSAMRSSEYNTTDILIQLGEMLAAGEDFQKIQEVLWSIQEFHRGVLQKNFTGNAYKHLLSFLEKACVKLKEDVTFFYSLTQDTRKTCLGDNDYMIRTKTGEGYSLIGFGEVLSSKIFSLALCLSDEDVLGSEAIDLSHLVVNQELSGKNQGEVFLHISDKIYQTVQETLSHEKVLVLPGYIGEFEEGIDTVLGRGYTDATAAMLSVGLQNHGYTATLEIQKSVRGILSADPRVLERPEDAVILSHIDYTTAREITGDSGAHAKLLHSQALRSELQDAGVNIHIVDPFSDEQGSWVMPKVSDEVLRKTPVFIGGRKDITFFSISSGKMFERGVLSGIFDIVRNYYTVDIVSTSETEVTFTIDQNQGIENKSFFQMLKQLRNRLSIPENSQGEFIEYEKNKALIFCIGSSLRDRVGVLAQATSALSQQGVNIELASQGRLQRAMVFGIDSRDMQKAVNTLHDIFVCENGVFEK